MLSQEPAVGPYHKLLDFFDQLDIHYNVFLLYVLCPTCSRSRLDLLFLHRCNLETLDATTVFLRQWCQWFLCLGCRPYLQLQSQVSSLKILHWLILKTRSQHFYISQSATFVREILTVNPQQNDRSLMDNPESVVQDSPTPELMTAWTCQISGSQRKPGVLKLHKTLIKDDRCFRPSTARTGLSCPQECKNGILPLLDSQHVQIHVNHSN
jgi:hypothetical protein